MSRKALETLITDTFRNEGNALRGDKIIAQARDVLGPRVVGRTSTHNLQEIILKRNVLCVIDRAFRVSGPAMKPRR